MNNNPQKQCLFCKIISGEIPCFSIAKTDLFTAFLDINYINKGHTLVVPTIHAETIFTFPKEYGIQLVQAMQSVGTAILKGMNADGINIHQNNYAAAGQEIQHVHWHIIPRFSDDRHSPWSRNKYKDEGEMNTIAHSIRNYIATS